MKKFKGGFIMRIVEGTLYGVRNYNVMFGKYKISSEVKKIGIRAFYNCTKLKKIDIPENVEKIEWQAFYNCILLKSVIFSPYGLQSINTCAFQNCLSLENITLPMSLDEIGGWVFQNCKNLKSVELPKDVKRIENGTFKGCASLEKVILPENVKVVDDYVFEDCSSLEKIDLPMGLVILGTGAFKACESLKEIYLPKSIYYVESEVFYNCKSLEKVSIPKQITTIYEETFSNCSSLKTISLPENIEKIGVKAFCGCSSLEMVNIPKSIVSIDNQAFKNCYNLDLNIETSLFYINLDDIYYTLFNCKSVTIYNHKIKKEQKYEEVGVHFTTNLLEAFRDIRKKELIDKIKEYLSKSLLDFKYEEHCAFIDTIINNLENIKDYNYRGDFEKYLKDYISRPKVSSNQLSKSTSVSSIENQEISNSISNKDNSTTEVDLPYKDMPFELYDYGNKNGMLNFIIELKCEIDKILLENNITNDKCFNYFYHQGFIIEMIQCVLDNQGYDYRYALNNYMKNYMETYISKVKPSNDNKIDNQNIQNRIKELEQELKELKEQLPKKVSLEKKPLVKSK